MATTVYRSSDTHNHLSHDALHHDPTQSLINGSTGVVQPANKEPNTQLKLTSLLQTTLKLEPLFDLFFGQLQHLLKINSCHYCYEAKTIDIKLGKASTHTTDYSLTLQDNYLGNIIFTRKQRFSETELLHIESLLSVLIYPLRNALSYRDAIQQALMDPLTGLSNRGALDQAIDHQWQMAQRYEQHFSILMLDVDHFKQINDTYGHGVGDKVLKTVAKTISTTTRQTDMVYRYGGEEFVVILNKSNLLGASIIAERIRENISSLKIPTDNKAGDEISVTISIGGSFSANSQSPSELMAQADKVLYYAKDNGRNRVELAEEEKALKEENRTERKLKVTADDR